MSAKRTTKSRKKAESATERAQLPLTPTTSLTLSEEERRVRAERADERRSDRDALRTLIRELDPACETDEDPRVQWQAPVRIGGMPNGVLLDLARLSGRGKSGSRIVAAARYYDGAAPHGGEPHHYVALFAVYYGGGSKKWRSVGVAIHENHLRDVAAVLITRADELDAQARGQTPTG